MRLLLLLFLLALLLTRPGSPQGDPPLWTVHASTRSVTCLAPGLIGTTGGLRTDQQLKLPGVAIRGLSGPYVATDRGLYRGDERLTSEPTCAVQETSRGLATGHANGRLVWAGTTHQLPTRAPVQALAWDGTTLYAATLDGLFTTTEQVELSSDPLSNTVTALLPQVAGTAAGVFVNTNGEWSRLGPPLEVTALARTGEGVLLVGTPDQGVYRQQGHTLVRMPGHPLAVSALLDSPQGLLVGTPDGGAWCQGRPVYSWEGEIPGNQVMAVAANPTAVCAATFDNGLGILTRDWQRVSHFSDAWVNQVTPQKDGFLIRLSDGTILQMPQGRQLGKRDGWPKDWTSALGPGWVGTANAFYLQDGSRWQVFAPKPELQGAVVTCVARWRGSYWVGTQSGLFEVNPTTRQARRHQLNDTWITALAVHDQQLFVGTFSGGLSILGKGPVTPERIHCLLATPHGLWAGTPQGLLQVNRRRHLLGDQTVWCLAQRGDELWVGTDAGLFQTSQARLDAMPNSPSADARAVVDGVRGSAGAGRARDGLPALVPAGGLPLDARPALDAFGTPAASPRACGGAASGEGAGAPPSLYDRDQPER